MLCKGFQEQQQQQASITKQRQNIEREEKAAPSLLSWRREYNEIYLYMHTYMCVCVLVLYAAN